MSPFIVTTKRPCRLSETGNGYRDDCPLCSSFRVAVTTLEEAQTETERIIRRLHLHAPEDHADYRPMIPEALPESGGTVGPLPDGTVIEVEPVAWLNLLVGLNNRWTYQAAIGDEPETAESQRRILDAFNAQEAKR